MTVRWPTLSDPALAAFVGVGVALTRIPFLSPAVYGLDPDAARIAAAGAFWVETGTYVPSRLPSYPLPEAAAGIVWALGGGPLLFNALSAALSGLAATAFFLLLGGLGIERRRAALGTVAALMVPVAFGASVQSMDYIWALAPALGALAAAARGRPGIGGVLLGLAVGARLTTVLFAVPAVLLLPHRSVGGVLRAAGATLVVAALAYAIPLSTFGPGLFWFNDGAPALRHAVQYATLDVWGPLGLIALGSGGLGALIARRQPADRRGVRALGAGLLLVVAAYVRLPLEGGYLLPAVPFLVGLGALYLRDPVWWTVCALLIISPFALDLESARSLPDGAHVLAAGPGRVRLLADGPLLVDRARTRAQTRTVARVLAVGDTLGPDTGLRIGSYLPDAVMTAMRRTGRPPPAWLLYDGYPPRPWPERTADEALALQLDRPPPERVISLDELPAP